MSTRTIMTVAMLEFLLFVLKYRYKEPVSLQSKILTHDVVVPHADHEMSASFGFSSAVAEWGMLLRDLTGKGQASYDAVLARANLYRGKDSDGLRGEFIRLVKTSQLLANN